MSDNSCSHEYTPCIIKFWSSAQRTESRLIARYDGYCVKCGFINAFDSDSWMTVSAQEQLTQIDPTTRTIPTFFVPDFGKNMYVGLEE